MAAPMERTSTPGIFKRGSRYTVTFRDGQGKQRKRSARTLTEARALRAELHADVARGEHRQVSRLSFAAYTTTWLDTYQGRTSRGIRPATIADYRRDLERWALPYFGRMKLAEVEPRMMKGFTKHLADSGLKPATVRRVMAPVKAMLATAYEEGAIRTNPAHGLRLVTGPQKAPDERAKALTEDELARLIAETPDDWRLLIRFLADTGLRIGECLGLRWEHVVFGQRRVLVRERRYRGTVDAPKSSYGRRDVPLSEGLARALWVHRKTSRYAKDDDPVFASETGTPLLPENPFRRILKPAAERAGVPWCGFHTLRHTAATRFFAAGWNVKQVQRVLGHHKASFTIDSYIHLLDEDLPDPSFLDELSEPQGGNKVGTEAAEPDRSPAPRAMAESGD